MITLAVGAALASAVAIPHLVSLEHAAPGTASVIWFSALVLRALTMVFATVYVLLFLPATELFGIMTGWCWHAVLPFLATHLGFDGHSFGDAAILAPGFVLAASAITVAFGVARASHSIHRFVRRQSIGAGPSDSVIVGGPDVLVAAAGIARPQVVVSAGALTLLDDDELAASLAHERGHIARQHRFALLGAELCRSLARFLPGTRQAMRELSFHLERDADRWALARRHDPLALASAILKAATPPTGYLAPMLALNGGPRLSDRVGQLLDDGQARAQSSAKARVLATTMVVVAISATALLPATAAAGLNRPDRGVGHENCLH